MSGYGVWDAAEPAIPDAEAFEEEARRSAAMRARIAQLERELAHVQKRNAYLEDRVHALEVEVAWLTRQMEVAQ